MGAELYLNMSEKRERKIAGIVGQYGQRLFGFIRNRVPNVSDTEDILQEVWYQLSRVMDIESIDQMSGWLFRVARNKVTDRYRKKSEDLVGNFQDDEDDNGFKQILLSDTPDPVDENLKEIFWEALFSALDELPEKQRNAFIWNELEDQTFQEMEDKTGESIKTWISRKRYAVQHLRQRLGGLYEEFMVY